MTATALPLATALTDPSTTELQEKTALAAVRAALAEMGDPMGRAGVIQNLSLAFSVAASALTIALKTRAGANASATDPISAAMRNATLATGDFIVRNVTAALSLVVPSTATLGHSSAVAGDLYHYVIDNAGTLEPAVSMKYFGQQGIASTTAIAAASNSATTMYSTTARSNVAFRCVGHTIDTQATAGTWAAVPTTVELAPFDAGGNIQFPAVQNASSDPNNLDDYEEGTWVPDLKFSGAAVGMTYGAQTGTYVKIGRLVVCNFRILLTSKGSSAGFAKVGGFPFTNGSQSAEAALKWAGMSSSLVNCMADLANSDTGASILGGTAGATSTGSLSDTAFSNSSELTGTVTYQV